MLESKKVINELKKLDHVEHVEAVGDPSNLNFKINVQPKNKKEDLTIYIGLIYYNGKLSFLDRCYKLKKIDPSIKNYILINTVYENVELISNFYYNTFYKINTDIDYSKVLPVSLKNIKFLLSDTINNYYKNIL